MSEEQKKNDLADALAALASGEHHEEVPQGSGMEHAHEQAAPAPTPVRPAPATPKPARPAPPTPTSGVRPAPPTPGARPTPPAPAGIRPAPPRPAAAAPPKPAAPRPAGAVPTPTAASGAPVPKPRVAPPKPGVPQPAAPAPRAAGPAAPMRPSSPNAKVRPTMPAAGAPNPASIPGARPTAPRPPVAPPPVVEEAAVEEPVGAPNDFVVSDTPHEEAAVDHDAEVAAEAEAVAHVVEDDDTLNLPAPSEDVLMHRTPAPPRAPKQLLSRSLFFKQTMIPILLTVGVILTGLGGWSFAMGEDSPLAAATWIPIALLAFGALMLVFAVITMLQVKAQMGEGAE